MAVLLSNSAELAGEQHAQLTGWARGMCPARVLSICNDASVNSRHHQGHASASSKLTVTPRWCRLKACPSAFFVFPISVPFPVYYKFYTTS